jgi:alpha-tubulin suppressor-like RCC1 family protein
MDSVSCGYYFTVVYSIAGEVWSWGEGAYGALGIPGKSDN